MLTVKVKMRTSLHFGVIVLFLFLDCAKCSTKCTNILPDSTGNITVELGKEFTATCNIVNNSMYSAADIEWSFKKVKVDDKYYTKLNSSAVSLTVTIDRSMNNPLMCKASKQSHTGEGSCMYGIFLDKGYPPLIPKDLKCIALQSDSKGISPKLTCSWDPGTRDPLIFTSYTLFASIYTDIYNVTSNKTLTNELTVDLGTFPNHNRLTVYVEAKNALQTVRSQELMNDSEAFVKLNPPINVALISEDKFPTSLSVNWDHPISVYIVKVKYNIRYCKAGSSVWEEVPQTATEYYINSFRLQDLQPYTDYVVQIRCIHHKNIGYWSDWSANATGRTPEDVPQSKPDVWIIYVNRTAVKLIWKDPVRANGKITGYNITLRDGSTHKRIFTQAKEHLIYLKEKTYIEMTANNSVGVSPVATLIIPKVQQMLNNGGEKLNWSVIDGQLWVSWHQDDHNHIFEYIIQWISILDNKIEWQRVPGNTSKAQLEGNLEPFKRYSILVYPTVKVRNNLIYSQPLKPFHVNAYLKQGPPLMGPTVEVIKTKKHEVHLKWKEIPIEQQRGFLTNYTIFYSGSPSQADSEKSVVVGPENLSYILTDLASSTQYRVHIMVSNICGSRNGSEVVFYTKKFADGEIEMTVVAVCLGFLFLLVFIGLFILKKKEKIKKFFWPKVPDPSCSTIAKWSPDDCPSKSDCPKEATLVDVSVMEVDMFEGKSFCEDNKVPLPLKKDKYLSEENSSGIGGSSCMSSPRQSVSSNDEADSGQTTASTVQYSSVVASGYKGQTPSAQAAMFSRSESTQPLLDCEENLEHMTEPGSPLHTNSYFRRPRGLEQLNAREGEEPQSFIFSPMEEEDTPTLTEDVPDSALSYMPQRNGYRPQ